MTFYFLLLTIWLIPFKIFFTPIIITKEVACARGAELIGAIRPVIGNVGSL